jgi:glycosyltransferase involved in cell wall biosynthesis
MTSTRRPRILEVLYSFRVGGSEVVGLELAQQLSHAGSEVLCASIDGATGPLRARCESMGLSVVDLGISQTNVLSRNGISVAIAKLLATLNLDVIHLQHFLALNKLGLAARLARIPHIVVTEHSEAQLRDSFAARIRLRLNWRLAHRITVVHDDLRRYLVDKLGVSKSRIVVIPNGIDAEHWHAHDRAQRRADFGLATAFTFVFVGRLVTLKNVPGLITAFLIASSRTSRPMRLLVVGGGPEMERCKALLATNPLGSAVTIVGEQSDTRPFLAAADAFVLNSDSEGMPRSLLEAMAMGLPCIATAVGGIPELLRSHGWLTRPGDNESLVSALLEAASNPTRSRTIGAEGKSSVTDRFDSAAMLNRYQQVLLPSSFSGANTRSTTRDSATAEDTSFG